MSAKNPSAKAVKAREEAAKQRAEAARAARRRKSAIVSASVVALIVVAGAIGFGVYQATRPAAPRSTPSAATASGALPYGKADAPVTVDLWADFQCPNCQQYEAAVGGQLDQWVDAGRVKVNFHPIAILNDSSSGTKYSTRAAAASGCVADQSTKDLRAFIKLLYGNQPPEGASGLTNKQLVTFAKQAGADSGTVRSCITDGSFTAWADKATEQSSKDGVSGTPTVKVNGKKIDLTGAALAKAVVTAASDTKK